MDKLSRFEDPDFFKKMNADSILLHIINENEVNPLDQDFPSNSGKGKYILLKKIFKEDEGDPDYRDVFDIDNADLSEGESESKTEYDMQKQKESIKYASSFFLQPLSQLEKLNEAEKNEVRNIKYSQPIRMGYGKEEHVVYQRIIFKNTGDEKNVYEFIKENLERNGIEVEFVDASFDGNRIKYITSVDGKRENLRNMGEIKYTDSDMNGEKNASWEVLVDGKFLPFAIDKSTVKKNSMIEIRRKSGCGGGGISYDVFTLESDPLVNESLLPGFMQSYISNFKHSRMSYSRMNSYQNLHLR